MDISPFLRGGQCSKGKENVTLCVMKHDLLIFSEQIDQFNTCLLGTGKMIPIVKERVQKCLSHKQNSYKCFLIRKV